MYFYCQFFHIYVLGVCYFTSLAASDRPSILITIIWPHLSWSSHLSFPPNLSFSFYRTATVHLCCTNGPVWKEVTLPRLFLFLCVHLFMGAVYLGWFGSLLTYPNYTRLQTSSVLVRGTFVLWKSLEELEALQIPAMSTAPLRLRRGSPKIGVIREFPSLSFIVVCL